MISAARPRPYADNLFRYERTAQRTLSNLGERHTNNQDGDSGSPKQRERKKPGDDPHLQDRQACEVNTPEGKPSSHCPYASNLKHRQEEHVE